jgi:hypothetical protein
MGTLHSLGKWMGGSCYGSRKQPASFVASLCNVGREDTEVDWGENQLDWGMIAYLQGTHLPLPLS